MKIPGKGEIVSAESLVKELELNLLDEPCLKLILFLIVVVF